VKTAWYRTTCNICLTFLMFSFHSYTLAELTLYFRKTQRRKLPSTRWYSWHSEISSQSFFYVCRIIVNKIGLVGWGCGSSGRVPA
jgi:hypothetical protein